MVTLSVLMPNYNHGAVLSRALDSVVRQSRHPEQLVIVDDGSTDNSVEIIESYRAQYPFIELIRFPQNRGVFEAIKAGIAVIRGDFFCGLASDDYMMEGWISRCMSMADQYPHAGIIFGKTKIENEKQGKSRVVFFAEEGDQDAYWEPERFRSLLRRSGYFTYVSSSSIYRRDVWASIGGFRPDLFHYCDTFTSNVLGARYGVCYVSHVANVFIQSEGSYSAKQRLQTGMWEKIMVRLSEILDSGEFDDCFSRKDKKEWIRFLMTETIETPIWYRYFRVCQKRNALIEKIESPSLRFLAKGTGYLITGILRVILWGVIGVRGITIRVKYFLRKRNSPTADTAKTHES